MTLRTRSRNALILSGLLLAGAASAVALNASGGVSVSDAPGSAEASAEQLDARAKTPGRVIEIAVNGHGFTPSNIEVKKGEAVTLRFTRTTDKTCATAVDFPELKLRKELPLNQPVDVQVPTGTARTLVFQCGMGMHKSSVVIH